MKPAAPGPRKMMGARSPDETGMLQMVPLSDNEDEKAVGNDPSATSFFAIPAPKADRSKVSPPTAPPSAVSGPPASRSGFSGPPSFSPTPMAAGPGQPPMQAPQPMVSGPVVGYGSGGGGGTPFQVAGPQPTGNNNADSRVQSVRVFAVLLGVFALACVAVLSVVALWFFQSRSTEKPPEAVAIVAPATVKQAASKDDTGVPKQRVETKPAPVKPKQSSGSSGPRPQAAPVEPKLGAKAPVNVTFSGTPMPMSVEINCPSGFRDKRSLAGGTASVPDVPTGESCQLHPKGAGAPTSASVRGGKSYNCTISGTVTSCR